jgi:hypothetical protein
MNFSFFVFFSAFLAYYIKINTVNTFHTSTSYGKFSFSLFSEGNYKHPLCQHLACIMSTYTKLRNKSWGDNISCFTRSLRNCSLQGAIPDLSSIPQLGYLWVHWTCWSTSLLQLMYFGIMTIDCYYERGSWDSLS